MENSEFPAAGDEIERALMDLGPLLGVTVKEEVQDEHSTAAATANASQPAELAAPGPSGESPTKDGDGADSLASPLTDLMSLKCVLCQLPLAQAEGTPKLMECLHSACEPCIRQKIEEKQSGSRDFLGAERLIITCPSCKMQCQPQNMIDQRFILEKINLDQNGAATVIGDRECSSCEEPEPASSYCVDCGEFICDSCVLAHRRLKITKDHTIKSKEEAVAELQAEHSSARNAQDMFCAEHPQERLSLFCETCDRLTCRDCQLQHHRDHKHQFSSEMAAQARSSITALVAEVRYKRALLSSAMQVIKDRQALIADKKKSLVRDCTNAVVKLTNAINTRGKQLVLRLNEVCDAKQRTLDEKKKALEQLAAQTEHAVRFVNTALVQGSDTAVLYSKRAVCAQLQRVKSRRADIPNPDIPVRIALTLDYLPQLLQVLSTFGGIYVDGKVDGAGGGAQGPYHPPQQPPSPAQLLHHQNHQQLQTLQQQQQQSQPHHNNQSLQSHQNHQGSNHQGANHQVANHQVANHQAAQNHQPSHSAVVALQHVALQQYVQCRDASGMNVNVRALRHPHVSSTTHPHHNQLHGMSELNLRGLLNQSGARAMRPPPAAMQAYQHMLNQYNNMPAGNLPIANQMQHNANLTALANMGNMNNAMSMGPMGTLSMNVGGMGVSMGGGGGVGVGGVGVGGGGGYGGRRSVDPRTPSPAPHLPAPPLPPAPAAAKWHIPQQSTATAGTSELSVSPIQGNVEYKIMVSRQQNSTPARHPAVTSTHPNTPSPNRNSTGSCELDAVCARSVQELMATIAKLDSNGVQVVRERSSPASPQHHVSSTQDKTMAPPVAGTSTAAAPSGATGADPNEDWCAVCMDGGELMCCDKCPKVFHQYCHIPTIDKLPDETETWQCLLCVNFAELPPDEGSADGALTPRLQKLIERITLELYCQYEASLPFREPVPLHNVHYHSKVGRAVCLDDIRGRLQPASPSRYTHLHQFLADCRLLLANALSYNEADSQIYKDAKRLESFFESLVLKLLPEYAYSWRDEGPEHKRPRHE